MKKEKSLINYSLLDYDEVLEYLIKEMAFIELGESCNYDAFKFQKNYVFEGINKKSHAFRSDFHIRQIVIELTQMPWDFDNLSDKQYNFIRDLSNRYLKFPNRFNLCDYLALMNQKKNN